MESSVTHPFAFFDVYLEKKIFQEWQNFKQNIISECGSDVMEINDKEHYITVRDIDHKKYCFYNEVRRQIEPEIRRSRRLIEQRLQETGSEKQIVFEISFLKKKLSQIQNLEVFQNFPFLSSIFGPIKETLDHFETSSGSSTSLSSLSYKLSASSENECIEKAERLYMLLTRESIIEAAERDFVNAFTGKAVGDGIKWLITGKNKMTNKRALIYFINELINSSHLPRKTILHFNPIAKNVFRDSDGLPLKNFRQSKSNTTHPRGKEILDIIVQQL